MQTNFRKQSSGNEELKSKVNRQSALAENKKKVDKGSLSQFMKKKIAEKIEAKHGENVQLMCSGSNARWTYKDKNDVMKTIYDDDPSDNKLNLKNVRLNDEGTYTCNYLDPLIGYVKDSFKLGVKLFHGRSIVVYNFSSRFSCIIYCSL